MLSGLPVTTATFDYRGIPYVLVPNSMPHVVSEKITFRGYDLPKGTVVIPNLYQSHIDSAIWKDPFAFNPDRWLDAENKIKSNPAFIPFSVGR